MSTFGDLIASIHTSLHSYSGTQEQATWLTADIDADDLVIPVGSVETALRGICEIDDELLYINSSDSSGLAVAPFGRGYRGSTAAAHSTNAAVVFDPPFPRAEIKRAIDQCVQGLFPALYQIKTTTFVYDASKLSFDLPADCESVIGVKYEAPTNLDYWEPIARWAFDPRSPLTNGKALTITDYVSPSVTVQVTYRAKFGTFVAGTDTLASVGLQESYSDLILYNVSARMIRFLDATRLQVHAVENVSRSQVVAAGDAGRVADKLYALYQQRLQEERRRLLEIDPPSMNFSR